MPELFEGAMILTPELLRAFFAGDQTQRAADAEAIAAQGALLLVDKPSGWTSFDVVAKARNLLRIKKVGHAGTLDPLATGLLVLCLGRATKLVERIQAGTKQYTGVIRFGATTSTDDAEGDILQEFPVDHLSAEAVAQAASSFLGDQLQLPPQFSARKVGGQRMYKLARRGQTVEAAPAAVTVYRFDITDVALPDVGFLVECSKGTYIRSLARDMGAGLGSGGHLAALRRTRSGTFDVAAAVTIAQLVESAQHGDERSAS